MATISMKQLLEAGIHFGHQTRRWNPKMGRYIFGERHGIYIIDLQKTLRQLQRAYSTVRKSVAAGGTVLFVGTKKQAQEAIQREAERCGMFFINSRWLGGTLTNWQTIQKSVKSLLNLEEMESSGKIEQFTKKEATQLRKQREKLDKNLCGIKKMESPPSVLFVIDSHREGIAVKEAARLGITCIAIVDTNSDPDAVPIPIPGNDDAIRAVNLFAKIIADAVIEGRALYEKSKAEEAEAITGGSEEMHTSSALAKQQEKYDAGDAPSKLADAEARGDDGGDGAGLEAAGPVEVAETAAGGEEAPE